MHRHPSEYIVLGVGDEFGHLYWKNPTENLHFRGLSRKALLLDEIRYGFLMRIRRNDGFSRGSTGLRAHIWGMCFRLLKSMPAQKAGPVGSPV